jgi:hypothetical protein
VTDRRLGDQGCRLDQGGGSGQSECGPFDRDRASQGDRRGVFKFEP